MKFYSAVMLLAVSMPLAAQEPGDQGQGQGQDPSQIFMQRFDANQDGSVSLDEFKAPQIKAIEQQFTFMDKGNDGNVDRGELDQFAQEMRKRMEQMRQQGGQAPKQ